MHELALMEDLVDTVCDGLASERAAANAGSGGDVKVRRVRLAVGARAGASAHALRFSFEVCANGTVLEGAALEIEETAGTELVLVDVEVE